MQIRTTRARVQPGQLDEFARRWQDIVAPHIPEVPGLRGVYLCGDRDTDTVMTIHLWESPPGEVAHHIHDRQRFRDQVRDLLASSEPVVEEYELLAQGEGR